VMAHEVKACRSRSHAMEARVRPVSLQGEYHRSALPYLRTRGSSVKRPELWRKQGEQRGGQDEQVQRADHGSTEHQEREDKSGHDGGNQAA